MTFSIVARCARTGRLGVAGATSSIAFGGRCPYGRSGLGVVVTQNRTDPTIGPRALDHLAQGLDAGAALAATMAETVHPEWRQAAVMDAAGRIASYNGARCSGLNAEARCDTAVALGNILADVGVPAAMIRGFEATEGALEDRLIAALRAGLAAGGEVKPLRSAAMITVGTDPFPDSNLRIDSADDPIGALAALWRQWRVMAPTCRLWAYDPGAA